MTKQQIFTAAHKLAKTLTGNYSARLSCALKTIYSLATSYEVTATTAKALDLLGDDVRHNYTCNAKITKTVMKHVSMPALQGSEKQIAWAEKIRTELLETALHSLVINKAAAKLQTNFEFEYNNPTREFCEVIFSIFNNKTNASFFIDNRDMRASNIKRLALKYYEKGIFNRVK